MDIQNIPRLESVVLTGLDFSMKPDKARYEAQKGFIKPFPEIKVMHQIKSLAVMVYNQEKMTLYYHGNVCDGRNSLAYFICAVHRQSAPQPKLHARHTSNGSSKSNGSSSSCKSTGRSKNCELPKLVTTSMLPLCYWDSLYYALVAEIRQLHDDLQNRFGFGCENGTKPLHSRGPEGTTAQPITAIDLASMLETAWYTLMDNRLVATLDNAVRTRRMREHTAKQQASRSNKAGVMNVEERPPIIYGLMDVNAISPETIISLLWDKHAPEIDRACCENFEDESMLTAYRADLHAKQIEESLAASTPLPSATICSCHLTCVCKLKCEKDSDKCTCQNRVQIYHLVQEQEETKAEVHSKYVKQDRNLPNHFLGAATNTLAQMQIAALADPTPIMVRACYDVSEANHVREGQVVSRSRQRANTHNSELAYVPGPKTPSRGPKDVFPLEFYGGDSGQRYPKLRPQGPTTYSEQPPPVYGSSHHTGYVPSRKAVPPPIAPTWNSYQFEQFNQTQEPQSYYQAPTPPSSSPYNVQTFTQPGQVTYPAIPVSQSQSMFTQSFPAPTAGNTRATIDDAYTAEPDTYMKYNDPAQDYIGLLARHPSQYEHHATSEPFPTLARAATTTSPKKTAAAATNTLPPPQTLHHQATHTLPTLRTLQPHLNKPQPPLPQPDFIAPRPALKQRYVSAGGNAKLYDRAEIPGPAFTAAALVPGSGGTISKLEVDAKMSDPEWVRRNFGEKAAESVSLSPPRRKSDESGKRNSGTQRVSDESGRNTPVDKRDRTSSGASRRVAKLKRVFARKNSGSEFD